MGQEDKQRTIRGGKRGSYLRSHKPCRDSPKSHKAALSDDNAVVANPSWSKMSRAQHVNEVPYVRFHLVCKLSLGEQNSPMSDVHEAVKEAKKAELFTLKPVPCPCVMESCGFIFWKHLISA